MRDMQSSHVWLYPEFRSFARFTSEKHELQTTKFKLSHAQIEVSYLQDSITRNQSVENRDVEDLQNEKKSSFL